MTDIEQALAEALGEDSPLTRRAARDIIAHPSMQSIARDAALVQMLERLVERADELDISWDGTEWEVEWWGPQGYTGTGRTLRAAIAAALDQPQETQQ